MGDEAELSAADTAVATDTEDGEIVEVEPPATWADQVELAEPGVSAPLPRVASVPTPSPEPPPPPVPPPPACPPIAFKSEVEQCLELLRMQGARISQNEDVLNRFQLIMDQTMGRLDGEVQRLSAGSARTMQALADLRACRDAIFREMGEERMQARVRERPAEAQFGNPAAFKGRGPPPYYQEDCDNWQQRRGRGRGGRR